VREKEVLAGVKLRKHSSAASEPVAHLDAPVPTREERQRVKPNSTPPVNSLLGPPSTASVSKPAALAKSKSQEHPTISKPPSAIVLGLGNYSSDED